jgi:hypothetical protein
LSDLERGGLSVETGMDSRNAFKEAYAAAELEAAREAGLIGDEQPRDDQGRFAAVRSRPVSYQPTLPHRRIRGAEAPVDTPAETLLAGKYKSVEDLERGYAELQQFAARQGNELGDLRNAFEQRFDELSQRLDQPHPAATADHPGPDRPEPGAAAQMAYEQNDQYTLGVAFEQWKLYDPAAASMWANQKTTEQQLAAQRAEYDRKLAEIEQRVAPIQAQNHEAELVRGIEALPADVKGFIADPAMQALASEFPTIGKTIVEGAPSESVEAIRALYDIHRGRTADTLSRTAQDVARDTAEAAQAAREDAYVASATASQEQVKTPEQIEQERAVASFTQRRSTWDEAFVRPGK